MSSERRTNCGTPAATAADHGSATRSATTPRAHDSEASPRSPSASGDGRTLHQSSASAASGSDGTLRAAIFDLDGTLFDTFEEHFDSWGQVCAEHGVALTPAQFAWSFGRRNEEIIPALWKEAGLPPPSGAALHAIAERKEELFRDRFVTRPRIMRGAPELLTALRAVGWKLGAGSSAPPANVEAFLAALSRGSAFDRCVSGADVTHGKPHPEVFLKAAERLQVPPSACIVFEDAPPGVEAARRAGMRCVAIVSRGRTRAELADADLLIDDFFAVTPESLDALLGRSPATA